MKLVKISNIFIFTVINLVLMIVCAQVYEENYYNYGQNIRTKKKYCLYRDIKYIEEDFYKWAGYSCYSYGSPMRFKNGSAIRAKTTNGVEAKVPYAQHKDDTSTRIFYFTYTDPFAVKMIKNSFKEEKYYTKWEHCVRKSEECCQDIMNNNNIIQNNQTCPTVWDGWYCFNQGALEKNSRGYCPNYSYMTDPPCVQYSYKYCNKNGSWTEETDYSTCPYSSVIRSRHEYHVIALYVSIAICVPAIIIFFCYSALRITRVILHRNLLIAIVFKNIFVILSKVLITLDAMPSSNENNTSGTVLLENGVACRVLAFFERASINTMYACMLVDGYYLHKIIVTVFRKDPPMIWLYSTVAILTLVPILIWAGLKAFLDNSYCWIVDDTWFHWIIDGSRYAILAVNLILLLDILRVLIWKLKKNSGLQHTKATLRATFILLPLFGIQFIMMSQRPVNAVCFWDNVFYYVSYSMDSSQGILVSLLYCYFNKEVQNKMHQTWNVLTRRLTADIWLTRNIPRRKIKPSKLESVTEDTNDQQ